VRNYIIRRAIYMVILMFIISFVSFIVIQLPPGDFITTYISKLSQDTGTSYTPEMIEAIKAQYGMNKSPVEQYFRWIGNILLRGDFGRSLEWKLPVSTLIGSRLPVTVAISLVTLLFTYIIAVPIGIYSARHQYSIPDYIFSGVGFIGLATPSFLLALVLMYLASTYLGASIGGIYSPEFVNAPWSIAKLWDIIKHFPIPVVVIGLQGTASVMRIMRANLLDELKKPYVSAARARGVSETPLLFKYPVRVAMNPIISTVGAILPGIISGATITAIVLDLPTVGALMYKSLLSQDMYLAGGCMMILALFTIIGTFISDILLVIVDPRIRLDA
jgi:peptide/nickel transport system permease protein